MSETIEKLIETIRSRKGNDVKSSYTSFLLSKGNDHCLNKLKEEVGELKDAIKNNKNTVNEPSCRKPEYGRVVSISLMIVSFKEYVTGKTTFI